MLKLPRVVIRGGGDLASGAAFRLWQAGFGVIILELATPRMVRRTVCFSSACYDSAITIEGVTGKLMTPEQLTEGWPSGKVIPVLIDAKAGLLQTLAPTVLVDARMLKQPSPSLHSLAPITVGLGPGFAAPDNVDYVVETLRGPRLGLVLERGAAIPDTGVPGVIGGESIKRLIKAPQAGCFYSTRAIGAMVQAKEVVGYIRGATGEVPVTTSLSGLLRGLVRDGLEVQQGEKIGDCDPRGAQVDVYSISDKARAVGGGVLEAVMRGLRKM